MVYCYHGNSSRDLCQLLNGLGFTQVYNLEGGWQAWAGYRDRVQARLSEPSSAWLSGFGFDACNLNSRIDNGMSALMVAAKEAQAGIVEELVKAGCDVNLCNDDDNAAQCRHFVSYSGVKLPLKLVNPLEEAELDNRNTYFRGYFDEQERIIACEKVVYGEIEFEHRYEYYSNGALKRAEVNTTDEAPRTLCFDEQGRPASG